MSKKIIVIRNDNNSTPNVTFRFPDWYLIPGGMHQIIHNVHISLGKQTEFYKISTCRSFSRIFSALPKLWGLHWPQCPANPAGARQPDARPTHIHMSFTVSGGGEVGQARGASAEPSWLLISSLPAWTRQRMDGARAGEGEEERGWPGRGGRGISKLMVGSGWKLAWDGAGAKRWGHFGGCWYPDTLTGTSPARDQCRRPQTALLSPRSPRSEAGRQAGVSAYSLLHTHLLETQTNRKFSASKPAWKVCVWACMCVTLKISHGEQTYRSHLLQQYYFSSLSGNTVYILQILTEYAKYSRKVFWSRSHLYNTNMAPAFL